MTSHHLQYLINTTKICIEQFYSALEYHDHLLANMQADRVIDLIGKINREQDLIYESVVAAGLADINFYTKEGKLVRTFCYNILYDMHVFKKYTRRASCFGRQIYSNVQHYTTTRKDIFDYKEPDVTKGNHPIQVSLFRIMFVERTVQTNNVGVVITEDSQLWGSDYHANPTISDKYRLLIGEIVEHDIFFGSQDMGNGLCTIDDRIFSQYDYIKFIEGFFPVKERIGLVECQGRGK